MSSSSPSPSTRQDIDAFITKMNKHRKKPPSAVVAVAEASAREDAVGRTSDSTSTTRATTASTSSSSTNNNTATTNNISLRPRTMFAMKGRGRTESEGAAYRPQWSKDGEGFVSSSATTTATATATTTATAIATTTSSTGPLSMKDAILGGGDDHRNDRRKPKVLRYSKEELLALHRPTNELPEFLVETSVASEHSLPPVATLSFDYEEIYKQWSLNRNRGRGRGRSNATATGAGAGGVQGTRGHQARGDETLDGAKDEGVVRVGHKERDSMWERGAKITDVSSRGDCIWDDVLEPGTDSNEMDLTSMATAAEIFRREMDAMRDELQGPKVDPKEIKDDFDAFDKKLEDAAAAGQFEDSDTEETPWDDPASDDQKATEAGNNLSDEHAANPSDPQSSDSHLFDALEPAADTQLGLEEKGSHLFSQALSEETSAGPPSSCVEMVDEWFYLDPQGLQRGPFTTAEMREWFEAGYFKPHLPIRFGQHGIFTALASQFVPGQIPFATLPTRVNSVGGIHMDPILGEQQRLLELQHEQQRQQQMMQLQQQQQQQRMLQLEQDEKIRIEMQRLEIARQQQQTQLYQQQQILRDQQEKQRQQQQQQQQQFFLHQQQNSWQLSQREGIMSALGLFGGNQANVASTDSFRTDGMESQLRSEYHVHHQMNTQNAPPVAQSVALANDEAQRRTQAFWPNAAPEISGLENITSLGLQSAQPKSPVAPDSTQLPESNRSAPISDAWARRQHVPEQSSPTLHDIQVETMHRAAQESCDSNQTSAQHGQSESALSATPTKKSVKSGGVQKNSNHAENGTVATDAWAIGTTPTAASSKAMSLKAIQQEEQRELLEKRNRDKGDTAHLAQMGAQLKMMLGVDSMAVTPQHTSSVSVPQATVAKSTATSTPVPTPSSPSPVRGPWGQPPAVVTSDKSKSMRDILAEEERLAQERAKANANAPVNSQWVNIVAGNKAAAVPKPSRSVLGPVPASVLKSRQQVRATNGAQKPPPSKTENDASFWNFGAAQPAGKESVISVGNSNAFGSNSVSSGFMVWASKQLKTIDVNANVTLLEYCASVEDPGEVREYLAAYLGSTPRVSAFATEFIQRKKLQPSGRKSPGHQDALETDSSNRRGKRRS